MTKTNKQSAVSRWDRPRTTHPLTIRSWVTKQSSERGIYHELLARIAVLDTAIRPYVKPLAAGIRSALQAVVLEYEERAIDPPELTPETMETIGRMVAASIVEDYWRQHPYRAAEYLPSIMTLGDPSAVLPDMVHILDLDSRLIRLALRNAEGLKTLRQDAQRLDHASSGQPLLSVALFAIRTLKAFAILEPVVQQAAFMYLMKAQYAPSKKEAEKALHAVEALFGAFRPHLTRHMTRRPDRLEELKGVFARMNKNAECVLDQLRTSGVTPATLALARDCFGGRIDGRDLERWFRMTPRALALDLLRAERRLSRKALEDQLRLADTGQEVRDAWALFLTYLRTLPAPAQRRVTLFPPPPTPPPPPSRPTPTR